MICEECGNAKFILDEQRWKCQLESEKTLECLKSHGRYFISRDKVEATINAEFVATSVAGIVFNQSKAKIFNVLESQIDNEKRLAATKRITQDIIADVVKKVYKFIIDILGNWEGKVFVSDILKGKEEEEAKKNTNRR